ncbi:hypothetical protein HA402_014026 [Bradysia odoriphaga]|nr:hypothetical protein HA402_014026 [Bradysia odoriphaga]
MLPHSIVLEHDYCIKNSIIMSTTEAAELNSIDTDVNRIGESFAILNAKTLMVKQVNCATATVTGSHFQQSDGTEIIASADECIATSGSNTTEFEKINDINGSNGFEISPSKQVNENENISEDNKGGGPVVFSVATQDNFKPKSRVYNPGVRKMRYLQERNKQLKKKLKEAESAKVKSNKKSKVKKKIDGILEALSLELPAGQFNFIKLQLKNTGKARKGNRFTFEDKTLALVIYKQNPKRYRDLCKISNLPTRQTLIIHSAAIRFMEGLNQNLMNFIKQVVSEMGPLQRVCTIGWDELSLTSSLQFDHIKDYIDGFEDLGSKRTNNFATHALVFMVRGVQSPYKQPISYFLTENLSSLELSELVRLVISAVIDTGLKVIGSVCDAVSTNQAAVNRLIGPKSVRGATLGNLLEYSINGAKIAHIFDPPHLMKSVRNNLLVKNLRHTVSFNETKFRSSGSIVWNEKNKQKRTAYWKDVSDFFDFNNNPESGLFNLIPKITPDHINPTRRKMKVSLATQVFSATCGRNMYMCAKRKQFLNDCVGTAAVLIFFNALFDSVNSADVPIPGRLIGAITKDSEHSEFWDYAIRMLDIMKFSASLTTGRPNRSNVCKHFVSTLKGVRRISERLFDMGFESVGLRRMNQDGLENHFFKIRNNCGSNPRPNARDFRNAYTTAIVSSQLSSHSLKANCEADVDKYILQDFQTLFTQGNGTTDSCDTVLSTGSIVSDVKNPSDAPSSNSSDAVCSLNDEKSVVTFAEGEALNCIAGVVCKQLLKKVKCNPCAASVTTTASKTKAKRPEHDIMRKQSVENFVLPKIEFIDRIKFVVSEVQKKIPILCAERNITQKLVGGLSFANNDESIGCDVHRNEFLNEMKRATVKLVIERYTVQLNRILSGKVSVATDNLQEKALEFRNKKKHIGKFIPPALPKSA